jgi:hypothetical protein
MAQPSDAGLESKMAAILAALAANRTATGADQWEGKPEQEPLPIRFQPFHTPTDAVDGLEGLVVGPSDDSELNDLMSTYVKAVTALRESDVDAAVAMAGSNARVSDAPEKLPDPASQTHEKPPPRTKEEYEKMSLAELLSELDAATA